MIKNCCIILLLVICLQGHSQDPVPTWIKDIKGGSDWPYYLDTDNEDNIYMIGRYYENIVYDGNIITPEFEGNSFLIKVSPEGELLWIKTMKFGNPYSSIYGVAGLEVDLNGDLLISGYFTNKLALEDTIIPGPSYGELSYVLKYSPDGNRTNIFLAEFAANAMTIDVENNLYLCGDDFSVYKLSTDLEYIWSFDEDDLEGRFDELYKVGTDLNQMVYLFGEYRDYYVFNGDTTFGIKSYNPLLLSLDAEGNIHWMNDLLSDHNISGHSIDMEGMQSGFVLSGRLPDKPIYYEVDSICPLPDYIITSFIALFEYDGSLLWNRKIGCNYRYLGMTPELFTGNRETFYVFDDYAGDILVDDTLMPEWGRLYVAEFDLNGNRHYTINDGGVISPRVSLDDIAVNQQGNIIISGYYEGLMHLDDTLLFSNDYDIYLASMDPFAWSNIQAISEYDDIMIVKTFPNPFTNSTTLSFRLSKPENVHFTVYNVQSQIVFMIEEWRERGEQEMQWNADGLPAGLYFYQLQAGDRIVSGKLVIK